MNLKVNSSHRAHNYADSLDVQLHPAHAEYLLPSPDLGIGSGHSGTVFVIHVGM